MADVWGVLNQSKPAATTLTDAYTCPASKHATVEVVLCNVGADATVRMSHAIAGAVDTAAQYLLYGFALAAGESKVTVRFTLRATDVLRVYSSTGDVAFTTNGIEEDN
jgi:hypothetical protein